LAPPSVGPPRRAASSALWRTRAAAAGGGDAADSIASPANVETGRRGSIVLDLPRLRNFGGWDFAGAALTDRAAPW
jgi:hypothetical protein